MLAMPARAADILVSSQAFEGTRPSGRRVATFRCPGYSAPRSRGHASRFRIITRRLRSVAAQRSYGSGGASATARWSFVIMYTIFMHELRSTSRRRSSERNALTISEELGMGGMTTVDDLDR